MTTKEHIGQGVGMELSVELDSDGEFYNAYVRASLRDEGKRGSYMSVYGQSRSKTKALAYAFEELAKLLQEL